VEVAFTLAAGVLRAPPVTLDAGKAKVSSDLKVDFPTRRVAATGSVTYLAGDEALVGSEPSVGFTVEGPLAALSGRFDTEALAQFLTQRALEREQARVEALQASLIEKQRLRREVRYYASLQFERDRAAEAQRRAEEEARRAAEEKRTAEEAARAAATRAAEEAAKAAVEEEAKRRADEAAKAEDAARAAADEERRKQEAEARRRVEEEKRRAEEQQKIKAASETDVANDAAKQKSGDKSEIERAPLPPAQPPSQPAPKAFNSDAISNFLKSLEN
jgi:membrane protein involved in colicin uptake